MINLTGQPGRDAVPGFTAANFAITSVPEPFTFSMLAGLSLIGGCCILRRKETIVNNKSPERALSCAPS